MNVTPLEIPEVMLIEPKVFGDDRGYFYESFNHKKFMEATGVNLGSYQDNQSLSQKGVLRGLHYQLPPMAQGKLVRVIRGEVFDVAVDVRKNSPTFGKWVGAYLSGENKKQLWVPEGFAHGFQVLTDEAEVLYKTSNYYSAEHERGILWNDPAISINWPGIENPSLSEKDAKAPLLKEADLPE